MQKTLPDLLPTQLESWKALEKHQKNIAGTSIKEHF